MLCAGGSAVAQALAIEFLAADQVLAHGMSIALYNSAYGLVVAVPAMIFYRHFRAKVDEMLVDMEMQGIKLVEILHGERQA